MTITPILLQNDLWQVGILPTTGASIAFGRVRQGESWLDVMRPTAETDYSEAGKCSSFIMLPWCNRIKDGKLHFNGQTYQLETANDGTARHGDARTHAWEITHQTTTQITMQLDSLKQTKVNFPFAYAASADYRLEGQDFVWTLSVTNQDSQPFPAGFGHHPYFVKTEQTQVQIPCEKYFDLVNFMAVDAPIPLSSYLDFLELKALEANVFDHLLTERIPNRLTHLVYPEYDVRLSIDSDPIFEHILIYAPANQPFYAVEPMTNASDGFNLYDQGIAGSGVFVVQPGEIVSGEVRLRLEL